MAVPLLHLGSSLPTYITTRAELNAAEQNNIIEADHWAFGRRRGDVLNYEFLMKLHRRMLGSVWRWAGAPRSTERNIGVSPHRIEVDLDQLLDDVRYWVENQSYAPDEIAVRFHHRLVAIHTFPNGNGRHARLAADLLGIQMGQPQFTWGRQILVEAAVTRKAYVAALRSAAGHDIQPLLAFART